MKLALAGAMMMGGMQTVEVKAPPLKAYTEFCASYVDECKVDRGQPAIIEYTAELVNDLRSVTIMVNGLIKDAPDQEHWNVADRWDFAESGYGDCEDKQLLKRKILEQSFGLPHRAMRMAEVLYRNRDGENEGHAVMLVFTTQGVFVLDNLTDAVKHVEDLGHYQFLKRESSNTSEQWVIYQP